MKRLTSFCAMVLVLAAQKAHALTITPKNTIGNGKPDSIIQNLFVSVTGKMARVGAVAAVICIMWYGIQYIQSAGNSEKAKAARSNLINVVLGIVIVTTAYVLIQYTTVLASFLNSLFK